MNEQAVKELLFKMADDLLILGHRNSEWIGFGPILEEDIAFASMAQDKVGQSLALYQILENLGEVDPDRLAFQREAKDFKNSIFVELPIGEYDFSLIRHFLYDTADYIRFSHLKNSAYEPLAQLATKYIGENRYHTMHARMWVKNLGKGTEESNSRMQQALDYALPYALGIFEKSPFEQILIDEDIFVGEDQVKKEWLMEVIQVLSASGLKMANAENIEPIYGGRQGRHSEYLQPLLDEMAEVINIDPEAEW